MGDALGIHPFSVSRWERGVREIPSFLLLALERLECMKGGEKKLRENKKKTEKEKGR